MSMLGVYSLVTCFVIYNMVAQTSGGQTFNPEILQHDYMKYVNDPVIKPSVADHSNISLSKNIEANNLLHSPDPKHITEDGCVMGIALYKNNIKMFKRFVGSLRHFGYNGHIILGVLNTINQDEVVYLRKKYVTLYAIEISSCAQSAVGDGKVKGAIRNKCSKDIPDLKLEWGRFEMARRWLVACKACTGWSLVVDVRDTFFQGHPFRDIKSADMSAIDLLFVEEVSPYTLPAGFDSARGFVAGNVRNQVHTVPCYGKTSYRHYKDRPVLCSGSIIGTRLGMLHFLTVLVTEFYENNNKVNDKCKSPHTTDQWIMNWLYYNGKFGRLNYTATLPWGLGPVLTVGKACMTENRKTGATDIVPRVKKGRNTGLLLNQYTGTVAPVIHQFDRCSPWIMEYFEERKRIFNE